MVAPNVKQSVNTNINFPQVPFLDNTTGYPSLPWMLWLQSPSHISINLGNPLGVLSGGTDNDITPENGELLIGNGVGYTVNPPFAGTGISITKGVGTLTFANSGVTSIVAGTGISESGSTGAVTLTNTGVTSLTAGPGITLSSSTGAVTISNSGVSSFSAGSTGLTPSTPTTGAVTLAGTLNAASGGTGANTLTGYVYGNGTSAMTASTTIPNTSITGLGTMSTQNVGISGTFKSGDIPQKTITVTNGIITNIV